MNLKIGEVAKKLGISVKTLQRWDNEGVFVALRNPKNQRYYTEDQINDYTKKSNNIDTDVYRFIYSDSLYDFPVYEDDKEYDKLYEILHNNEDSRYKNYNNWFIYKKSDTNEIAKLLQVKTEELQKMSHTIENYIYSFDGDCRYIRVFDMEISMEKCIDYLCDNINTYIATIYDAIEGKTDLETEIEKLINEVLVDVVTEDFNTHIKELKRRVQDGNVEWR